MYIFVKKVDCAINMCLNYIDKKRDHAPTGKSHQKSERWTKFFAFLELHVPTYFSSHEICAN